MGLTFEHSGKTYSDFSEADALAAGVPQDIIDAASLASTSKDTKARIRGQIRENVGDPLTLLGTTADAAALSTLGIAALTVAVANSTTFAEFKVAYLSAIGAVSGTHDMAAISASFLAKIAAGTVKIPIMEKDLAETMGEIEARSTAVADAIAAS